MAHITGGGLSNLLRLHNTLGWEISNPLPIHPEFNWIAEIGIINNREMHRTFNMGMGMVLLQFLQKMLIRLWIGWMKDYWDKNCRFSE